MRPNKEMDPLLDELAVYKTELARGTVTSQLQRIKNLIESIPDINVSSPEGYTYLMIAVMQYKADIVRLLLEAGADPNIGRKDGVRPLAAVFLKRMDNREEIVRLLLDHGADPSLAGRPGQTAFDFAEITQAEPRLIQLLEQANEKLHGVPRGMGPLHKK